MEEEPSEGSSLSASKNLVATAHVRMCDIQNFTPAHMVEASHACEAAATIRFLVAVVIGLEGAGLGKAHVLGLIVAQFGQMRIKGR